MAAYPPVSGKPVFRFAPSPNGRLHLGHALSALTNEALAQRFGGRLLLRIEDIDLGRCRPDYIDGVLADLDWLGIRFEQPVRRQSEHFDDYAGALASLQKQGLVYPCFCSRQEIKAAVVAREGEVGGTWPVDEALKHVVARASAVNKPVALYAGTAERAKEGLAMGARMVTVMSDGGMLRAAAQTALKVVRG